MGAGRMKSGPSPPQAAEHRQQALTLGKLEFLNFDGGILQHSHEVGVEMYPGCRAGKAAATTAISALP